MMTYKGDIRWETSQNPYYPLDLIKSLSKSLTEKYGKEPSAPSLLISWLGSSWYVSLVKYNGSYGTQKQVLISIEDYDLTKSLKLLANNWINAQTSELDKLKKLL